MEEIKQMFAQINAKLQSVEDKLDRNSEIIKELRNENLKLKETTLEQGERIEALEREIRRNNIVIQGIEDENEEGQEETENKIKIMLNKIGVEINMEKDIVEVNRLGAYKPNKDRPISVKIRKWSKKMEICRNAKNLKGTNIWIGDDFSKKVQEERKALIPHLKEARKQGHKALLMYNKLMVNGEAYKLEDLEETTAQKDNKRTASERSPGNEEQNQQLRKITRMSRKN